MLIIIGVLLFELIIFIHEFGHFFTAKLFGIQVNEFALGMGPKLFSFKRGETVYSLRAIPIGGFCAMEGEDEDSDNPRAFGKQPVWQRMIVICAGAVMNIILGLLFTLILVVQSPVYISTTVDTVDQPSPVWEQGLRPGDEFVSIDGYKIMNGRDIAFAFGMRETDTPNFTVKRDGETVDLGSMTFGVKEEKGVKYLDLGYQLSEIERDFGSVISQTGGQTVSTVRMIWSSLLGMVTGKFGLNDMSGPVGVASAVTEVASAGLEVSFGAAVNNILTIMMIITVNLGIFNMLPVPALDGGRFFFMLIELIRRKPIPPKYEGLIHGIGFALLIAFMLIISFNDIWRLITGQGFG